MKNIFIKYGIIYGIISLGLTVLYYQGITGMGLQTALSFGSFIVLLILAGIEYKKKNEGFAAFGELLKLFFGVVCVGVVIALVGQLIYSGILSDESKERMVQNQIDTTISMYESMGMDEDTLLDMEEKLVEKLDSLFKPTTYLLGSLLSVLMLTVISLIPAAILKKPRKD